MYPKPFQKLIDQLSSLPSIGPKMAERLTLYLFKQDTQKLQEFAEAFEGLTQLRTCTQCFNIADDQLCLICSDPQRDQTRLCVVEEALDIMPLERTKAFDGLYHVLGGTLDVGTSGEERSLTIPELLTRLKDGTVQEVIIATNFTTEGDATALYLKRKLAPLGITVTRLLRGLATGSDIEYADDMTIKSALANRSTM